MLILSIDQVMMCTDQLFARKMRDEIIKSLKEENPNFKQPEIFKRTGKLWKTIEPEKKQEFDSEAEELKKVHRKAVEEYKAQNIDTQP